MPTITQDTTQRNSSHANADEVEPILIAEWPLSRGEIARVAIRSFKGVWLIDLRKWFEAGDGQLRAGLRGAWRGARSSVRRTFIAEVLAPLFDGPEGGA